MMFWFIVLIGAIVGIHHIFKYLLPVFRMMDEDEREEFHRGGGL